MEHKCHQQALFLHENIAIFSLFKSTRVHCLATYLVSEYIYKSTQNTKRWAAKWYGLIIFILPRLFILSQQHSEASCRWRAKISIAL